MQKRWLRLGIIIFVLLLLEFTLRLVGFGHMAMYYDSPLYEYALKPNQNFTRFGKYFSVNAQGMRASKLEEGEWRILKFGDSVINGGAATDQSELASEILNGRLKDFDPKARVIQVSAGSWGPDNAFAWMQANGDFDAKAIILVFSSHDWQDHMNFQKVVGVLKYYPDQQPLFAIAGAVNWIYSRYFEKIDWRAVEATATRKDSPDHNAGWDQFAQYCTQKDIAFLVYHHASASEQFNNTYNQDGLALETHLRSIGVSTISGIEGDFQPEDFRDEIHLQASGQAKLALQLEPYLQEILGRP